MIRSIFLHNEESRKREEIKAKEERKKDTFCLMKRKSMKDREREREARENNRWQVGERERLITIIS
jgi:hypothetical protein